MQQIEGHKHQLAFVRVAGAHLGHQAVNGTLLFDHCNKFGFEGVVSKRLAWRYSGGPSRNWVKSKCPGWKRINAERYRLFERPPRKPELTEAQKTLAKKRQELTRVLEHLRSPGLSARAAQACRYPRAGNRRTN